MKAASEAFGGGRIQQWQKAIHELAADRGLWMALPRGAYVHAPGDADGDDHICY